MNSISNICDQITKKGKRCRKPKWKNSLYCYIHSITKPGKIKSVFDPRLTTLLSIIGILIGVYAGVYTIFFSPSKSTQEEMHENQIEQMKDTKEIKSYFEQKLGRISIEYDSVLSSRYNTGYTLVAHGSQKIVIPNKPKMKQTYKIDWQNIEMSIDEYGYVHVSIPEFSYFPTNIKFTNVVQSFQWNAKGDIIELNLMGPFPEDYIYVEIIDVSKMGIIYCFGLRSRSLPELEI